MVLKKKMYFVAKEAGGRLLIQEKGGILLSILNALHSE